jgi:hypothetical protein
MAKLSPNGTLTTVSSSVGGFGKHPHDTLHLDPADCIPKLAIQRDPDRISSGVLDMELEIGDEIGEI